MNTNELLMSQIKEGARFINIDNILIEIKAIDENKVQFSQINAYRVRHSSTRYYHNRMADFINRLDGYTLIAPTPTATDLINEAIKEIEKNADKHHKHHFQSGYDVCLEYCINILKSKLQNAKSA